MKLFAKIKDYHNLLEEILDTKTFSSVAKSLLLSMIYKLEISYKDYSRVKMDCIPKDEFFGHILEVIKKYCDHIKTVEPDSIQAKLLVEHNVEAVTNSKERSILVYPTENAILYAISDIEPKYFYIKEDFIFKDVLQKVLVEGYKQNNQEILTNFNGWSWDISAQEKQNYIGNLIYQNLIMIKDEQFLYDWRTDDTAKIDYLKKLKRLLKNISGNDNYYLSLCKLLYIIANPKDKKAIKDILEEKQIEYKKLLNESEDIKKENIKELNKLKNYDSIFNNNKSDYEAVIELQKSFLLIMKKKIMKADTREEIIGILYKIRYYQNTVLLEGTLIKEQKELVQALDIIQKIAITKACKMGIIKIISMDIDVNFRMIKGILDTKILNLEEIKVYLEIQNENICIKVYDKEIFEKQLKETFNGNRKDIVLKKKKVVKLFN